MKSVTLWLALLIISGPASGSLRAASPQETAETEESRQEETSESVTILVQGMMKSKSGAT